MAFPLSWQKLSTALASAFGIGRGGPRGSASPDRVFSGAPEGLRRKTYSAESGVVYQYVYRGREDAASGRPYVFSATNEGSDWREIRVLFPQSVVAAWEQGRRRTLRDTERYAIVKLLLFDRFDSARDWEDLSTIQVTFQDVDAKLDHLGLS